MKLRATTTVTHPVDPAVVGILVQRRQQRTSRRHHMAQTSTTHPVLNIIHLVKLASKAPAAIPRDIMSPRSTAKVGTVPQTLHRHRNMANRFRLRALTGNLTNLSLG